MITMFLIVILPLFAASIMLIMTMRSAVKDSVIKSVLESADSIRYRITDVIESAEAAASVISSDEQIVELLDSPHADSADYYGFFSSGSVQRYLRAFPQISSILVYTEEESPVRNANFILADKSVMEQEWYKNAVSGQTEFVWDVIENTDGEYNLSCIKSVVSNGRVVGVACVLISPEWISRFIANGSFKTILSTNGKRIYFSNYDVLQPGDEISFDEHIHLAEVRESYDSGFFGFEGYTVLESFSHSGFFQIILLIPYNYINYDINRISVIYGGYFGLFLILSLLIVILFTSVFSRRITLLSEKMHAVASGNFNVQFDDSGKDEISDLYTDLGHMISSMQTMMNDVYNAKLQNEEFKLIQMEAEFKALSSQINPHFLYNTLETIRMKAFCNNDKETANLVKKLGKFMRRCLEFKDGEVTLRSELEFTNGYLELQSARFGDRVSYSIYSEVSKDYMILPLIIQPVVENAFVHGIEGCKEKGKIDIKVYYSGSDVIIDVKDNGGGMSPERLAELENKLRKNDTSSGKSIGLTNVNKRIKMYHGEQYGLTVNTKEGKGTVIRITLPRTVSPRTGTAVTPKEKAG